MALLRKRSTRRSRTLKRRRSQTRTNRRKMRGGKRRSKTRNRRKKTLGKRKRTKVARRKRKITKKRKRRMTGGMDGDPDTADDSQDAFGVKSSQAAAAATKQQVHDSLSREQARIAARVEELSVARKRQPKDTISKGFLAKNKLTLSLKPNTEEGIKVDDIIEDLTNKTTFDDRQDIDPIKTKLLRRISDVVNNRKKNEGKKVVHRYWFMNEEIFKQKLGKENFRRLKTKDAATKNHPKVDVKIYINECYVTKVFTCSNHTLQFNEKKGEVLERQVGNEAFYQIMAEKILEDNPAHNKENIQVPRVIEWGILSQDEYNNAIDAAQNPYFSKDTGAAPPGLGPVCFITMERIKGKELKELNFDDDQGKVSNCKWLREKLKKTVEFFQTHGLWHRDIVSRVGNLNLGNIALAPLAGIRRKHFKFFSQCDPNRIEIIDWGEASYKPEDATPEQKPNVYKFNIDKKFKCIDFFDADPNKRLERKFLNANLKELTTVPDEN